MRRGSIPEMTVRYRSSCPTFQFWFIRYSSRYQIFFFFHRPCLNRIALAAAIEPSAIAMA
jgi:hypothetical protein